jgi:hypothetical protein
MSKGRRRRRVIQFFRLTLHLGDDIYAVIPLNPDPSVARKAFRLRKQTGDRNVYDIQLTERGPKCECRGFSYRRRCKHIRALSGARMLD